ncbi:MAG: hypothetical protein U0166_20915 [Acidobacteriota bacterium]
MTALRSSSIYLAAVCGVLGVGVMTGAVRALATQSETGVFLIGLTAGMGLWAWGLFLLATASTLSNIAAALVDGGNREGGSK